MPSPETFDDHDLLEASRLILGIGSERDLHFSPYPHTAGLHEDYQLQTGEDYFQGLPTKLYYFLDSTDGRYLDHQHCTSDEDAREYAATILLSWKHLDYAKDHTRPIRILVCTTASTVKMAPETKPEPESQPEPASCCPACGQAVNETPGHEAEDTTLDLSGNVPTRKT